MAMEANAANAAGSLQRIQRPQTTGSTDAVTRRGDGTSSSPFAKETNVSIRNSIADLSSVLGRISQGQEDSVEVLPDHLQKVIRNVMESAFSLSATLEEGLGSTTESQRFSLEQLGTLSRMLTQLGALAEKGVQVSDFSESMQTLLRNLKSLLTAQEGGNSLEPALLNKLSFQLLDAKALEDLPAALQQALTVLAQTQPQQGVSETSSFDFLKSLVQYFMPRPGEESVSPIMQESGQTMPEGDADAETSANPPMRDMSKGGAKEVRQETAGQMPEAANEETNAAQKDGEVALGKEAALRKEATQQPQRNGAVVQQNAEGMEPDLLPDAEDGASETTQQQKVSEQAETTEGKGQTKTPQEQSGAQQQKALGQGNAAEGKGQSSEQMLRGAQQEGKSTESAVSRQDEQSVNPQSTRQEGTKQNTVQEKSLLQGRNPAGPSTNSPSNTQGEAKASARQMPVMQNTPQLMQSLKETASFMLKNMPLTEKDAALLRDFINNGQKLLPDKEAKQLQLLLRLSQNNVPAAVNQAAVQKNLGDLPRLWAFMQLCDMTAVKDMKEQQLKRAGKDVAEFAASMKRSMEGGSLFQTDGKGNVHRSLNFMLPLYMGEGEKQSFPAYANVYDEEKYSPEDGSMHKETWLRLCVLTDHIGAVELTCQVYDAKSLNMRVLFSEASAVEEFKSYIPEFKESFRTMALELTDLKVSIAGSKE